MLSVENISYKVGNRQILDAVSFDAHAGQLLVILGNNGAGKSTLLKAVCNEIKYTGGKVALDGRSISEYHPGELALKRAVLKQHTQVNLPFLVKEIVMMGRYPHFRNKETTHDFEVVNRAIEKAGISHLAEQSYLTLSGGEQQRVQLARVLAQVEDEQDSTRYLLLDEPVSSLDIVHQHNTLRLAKQFAAKGNVVIAVLHDLNLAAMYADKILLLKQGRVLSTGTPGEVLTGKNISETFGFPAYVQQHPHAACLMVYFGAQPHQQQLKEKAPQEASVL